MNIEQSKKPGVVFLGLQGAGKTSILNILKNGHPNFSSKPTQGATKEKFKISGKKFLVFDVGGDNMTRHLWQFYTKGALVIVFVVDSGDRDSLEEAAEAIKEVYHGSEFQDAATKSAPLLILANKSDHPNCLPVDEIANILDTQSLPATNTKIIACSAATGMGLIDGIQWMFQYIPDRKSAEKKTKRDSSPIMTSPEMTVSTQNIVTPSSVANQNIPTTAVPDEAQ